MRFVFDASVTIAAALIGLLKPSVAKNFMTTSCTLQSYRYGHTKSENIEVIKNKEIDLSNGRVLIFVHGGAWGSGRPWMYRLVSQALMLLLCTTHVVIVGYPVYPSASIQKQTRSLHKAIKYIRKRLFPSGDFVLCGHSSGANISALCLLQFFSESNLSYITKFVGLSGVYDIQKHFLWEKDRGVHEISPMKGAAGSITQRFIKCSPTILLALNTTGVKFPPTLLIHCEDDFVVPVSSTVEFAMHLDRHGIKIDIFTPKVIIFSDNIMSFD
jgi:acetyl esterase/lipase